MSLTFAERLLIFFQLYLDVKYPDRDPDDDKNDDKFGVPFRELLNDLRQVVEEEAVEINGIYHDLEIIFTKEKDDNYRLHLRMKHEFVMDYLAILLIYKVYPYYPEHDDVLTKTKFTLLPGFIVEIKIKRGQA